MLVLVDGLGSGCGGFRGGSVMVVRLTIQLQRLSRWWSVWEAVDCLSIYCHLPNSVGTMPIVHDLSDGFVVVLLSRRAGIQASVYCISKWVRVRWICTRVELRVKVRLALYGRLRLWHGSL